MAKEHIRIPGDENEIECTCRIVYNRHGWGCQCDEGCPTGPDGIEFCPLHKAAQNLLKALKHAETRLNQVSTDYVNTDFKLIHTSISEAEGK